MPRALQKVAIAGLWLGKPSLLPKLKCESSSQRALEFLSQKDDVLSEIFNPDFLHRSYMEVFFDEAYFQKNSASSDFEKRFMDADRQSWLIDESLLRTDKMTMAWGLEARVPILDYRLVEAANKISTTWKLGRLPAFSREAQGKKIWKEVVLEFLPPHLRHEKKRGWFTPMAKWMRADLRDFVSDILSPRNLKGDIFDPAGVDRVWRDHLNGKRYNLNIVWAIVMWQLWYNQFIKQ